ncbi:ankyrin repeat-containing protein [Mycoplasmopsis columbina SF7]|uniref:Ankyrin repeat-containing protein n=1 Tax=Mycoplasmopsis columbina SF7 TaxID=1037410 RepID=F9UKB5_9BACT|nr:ankyrin repeat domain-containing protein [Mycoplasmopsis columbina]EGV00120.1 ankyrin repeat-containing protein [Mycoplasmopsis columbina SF7]
MKIDNLLDSYAKNKIDEIHEKYKTLDITSTCSWTPNNTLVHIAALAADAKGLEILLQRDADINAKNTYGDGPIHLLLKNEERKSLDKIKECLEVLFNHGVSLIRKNSQGQTPLHIAAEKGMQECVELLCEKGAKVNVKDLNGNTPLNLVVSRYGVFSEKDNYDKVAKILINNEANINEKNDYGESPLEFALKYLSNSTLLAVLKGDSSLSIFDLIKMKNYQELTKFLKQGVDVNIFSDQDDNTFGISPLSYAINFFDYESAKILIENGADVNLTNSKGENCLSNIFRRENAMNFTFDTVENKYLEKILVILHENNFNFDAVLDEDGSTPLISACKFIPFATSYNSSSVPSVVLDYLLRKNINTNAVDYNGKSALMYLVEHGNEYQTEYLYALLEKNARLDLIDEQGNTALIYACKKTKNYLAFEYSQIITEFDNYLLNHVNNEQENALSIAVKNNNEKLVNLLISK